MQNVFLIVALYKGMEGVQRNITPAQDLHLNARNHKIEKDNSCSFNSRILMGILCEVSNLQMLTRNFICFIRT